MPTDLDFNDDAELGDELDAPGTSDTPGGPENGSGNEDTTTPPESDAGIDISDYEIIAPLWRGGWQTVPTLYDRNSIAVDSRDEGMAVHVFSNGKTYVLSGGTGNSNWVEYRSGVAVDPDIPIAPDDPVNPDQPDNPDDPESPDQPGGGDPVIPPPGEEVGSCGCSDKLEELENRISKIEENGVPGGGGVVLPDGLSITIEEIDV